MPDVAPSPTRHGLFVAVRVSPRAKADRLGRLSVAADGRLAMTARVAAPPADGRANEALLRLLARAWRLSQGDLKIVAGAASRNKIVYVVGDPRELRGRLGGGAPPDR